MKVWKVRDHYLRVQLVERVRNVEACSLEDATDWNDAGALVGERVLQQCRLTDGSLSGYLCSELGFMPPGPTVTELGDA